MGTESMTERLRRISYSAMMGFLKQGSLQELASRRVELGPAVNTVDIPAGGESQSGFLASGIFTTHTHGKVPYVSSFAEAGMAGTPTPPSTPTTSTAPPTSPYVPVSVPPADQMEPIYIAAAETADRFMGPQLCRNPWPLVAAVIGVLSASEESNFLHENSKTRVKDAIRFLSERLATLVSIVDPSAPRINTANPVPAGATPAPVKGPARMMLQDIAKGLARRVPLTKLVTIDADVRPYLASLLVAAMHRAGDELIIPSDLKFRQVTSEAFEEMLRVRAGQTYDNYGLIAADLAGGKKASKAELDRQ